MLMLVAANVARACWSSCAKREAGDCPGLTVQKLPANSLKSSTSAPAVLFIFALLSSSFYLSLLRISQYTSTLIFVDNRTSHRLRNRHNDSRQTTLSRATCMSVRYNAHTRPPQSLQIEWIRHPLPHIATTALQSKTHIRLPSSESSTALTGDHARDAQGNAEHITSPAVIRLRSDRSRWHNRRKHGRAEQQVVDTW
ncbi:hypothetical protein MRB53_037491 [Persea americana]|nr:hypothetical protein MRB53_037491 [Persea americana]